MLTKNSFGELTGTGPFEPAADVRDAAECGLAMGEASKLAGIEGGLLSDSVPGLNGKSPRPPAGGVWGMGDRRISEAPGKFRL